MEKTNKTTFTFNKEKLKRKFEDKEKVKRKFKDDEIMIGIVIKKDSLVQLKKLKEQSHIPLRYMIEDAIVGYLKEKGVELKR